MHRLLKRQLRKANFNEAEMENFSELFDKISSAYNDFDQDMVRLENILEKSSRELFVANQKLKEDVENKSEEIFKTKSQLEHVLKNVEGVIFETDSQGKFLFLNKAWETVTGFAIEEALGRHYSEFLSQLGNDDKEELDKIACSDSETYSNVLEAKTKDGVSKWIEIAFKSIQGEDEKTTGVIGSIIDVTTLKKTEIELKKSQQLYKKASLAKEDFLSTMSHEIRTPLNGVIGITNILLMDEYLDAQYENLQGLKYSSEHLLALINDILDYSKIEAGRIDLENKDFDFNSLITSIKRNFEFQAAEKGIKFKVKRDDEIPNYLIGDSTRLSQVINNLLSNAIKFTSEGQVVLDIEEVEQDDKNISIHFQVKDTGIGIPTDKLPHIFEKFKQAESSITRKFGGSGLGLSICNSLIDLMGGKLEVDSIEDKGSNFKFTLKFDRSEKFDSKAPSGYLSNPMKEADLSGIHILIAEDNKLNQHVVKRFLSKWNATYDIADNGEIAVEQFLKGEYDIILMDLQMPVMNGYDASRIIKEKAESRGKPIPIIALTASAHIDVKFKTRAIGMTGFLTKPFNPIQLYETIKEQMEMDLGAS